jgi:hypothetical protein
VRWAKGGSRAAAGDRAAVPADVPGASSAADAAQIQALLTSLSETRLAVSADLSAAAGALEDGRADIAADVIAGARGELAVLRAAARRRERAPSPSPRLVSAGAGASRSSEPLRAPFLAGSEPPERRRPHLVARALAGAAALAIAVTVLPHVAGGASHPATDASQAGQPLNLRLANSEFSLLRQRLGSADASPAAILAAGRRWQHTVASGLPAASAQRGTASAIVTMLREERSLMTDAPALRSPSSRSVSAALATASDALLARLRQLADPEVLALLPTVIAALPAPLAKLPLPRTTSPAEATPSPSSAAGEATTPPLQTQPSTGPTSPAPPLPTNGTLPVDPHKVLPVPLPSPLGQLGGGAVGGLGQTVGTVLNGLGLSQ